MMDWSSVEGSVSLERGLSLLSEGRDKVAFRAEDGRSVLSWRLGPDASPLKAALWIDHARGFTPTRLEVRAQNPGTETWSEILSLTEAEWSKVDDVWVPVKLFLQREFNHKETYSLDIKWDSVNSTIPDALFTPEGLDVDPNSLILDRRLGGKPVVVGKVNDPEFRLGRPTIPKAPDNWPTSVLVLLGAHAIVIVAVATYLWLRRAKR
jgi:hypothetical protein